MANPTVQTIYQYEYTNKDGNKFAVVFGTITMDVDNTIAQEIISVSPTAFIMNPIITITPHTTVPRNVAYGTKSIDNQSFTLYAQRTETSPVYTKFDYHVVGMIG